MGLFHRKPNRNPNSVPLFGVLLVLLLLTTIFLFEVHNLSTQTKTIIGYNLQPTPWHEFPAKQFNNETKIARASKIIQCSYLSCGMMSHNDKVPFTGKSDKCPGFFKWIHHDLEPWSETRISYDHLMEVKKFASFRVVIIGGKLYVEYYYDCVQSRAMFTIWGLLQLLKRYPGRIPDVDLMFDCMDKRRLNPCLFFDIVPRLITMIFRFRTGLFGAGKNLEPFLLVIVVLIVTSFLVTCMYFVASSPSGLEF
ncbi:putative glycosyl transferase CAP10 domain-containing protein [Helianthus anomalus]